MRILHISDLHPTRDEHNLDDLWCTVEIEIKSFIKDEKLDFIVVSGDLSQSAEITEYANLKKLAFRSFLPLLKEHDPRRIIFVPGNHDVQWGTNLMSIKKLDKRNQYCKLLMEAK